MSYATPANFTRAYGLRETTQLLQDESKLLTEALLSHAMAVDAGVVAGTNTPTWADFVPPALDSRATPQDAANRYAWGVYADGVTGAGIVTWAGFVPPVGYTAPTVLELAALQALADQRVLDSIVSATSALDRLQTFLDKSTNEIDGYLRGSVPLPISPALLSTSLLDECCWVLTRCRLADDCDNSSDKIEAGCKEKREWLKAVAKGTITLVDPTGLPIVTTSRFRVGQTESGFDWRAHARMSGSRIHMPMQTSYWGRP